MLRRLALFATALAVALPVPAALAQWHPKAGPCGRVTGCTHFELVHAGATYGWYPTAQRYEFETKDHVLPPPVWTHTGTPTEWNDHFGTLMVSASTGDVTTTWTQAHRTGRWETRFRSVSWTPRVRTPKPTPSPTASTSPSPGTPPTVSPSPSAGPSSAGPTSSVSTAAVAPTTDYRVQVRLVPANGAPCQWISMLDYNPTAQNTATFQIQTPSASFTDVLTTPRHVGDLGNWDKQGDATSSWHEWGVEVAKDHISWFVDGQIAATERRPQALLGVPLRMEFSLVSQPGASMVPATMQIDWARYWSLKNQTRKRSLTRQLATAPGTTMGAPAC